uniref:Uncharacterized protein n=1 Tax=Oryza brachyantha TaxID=4533 RepID=J3NEH8_ORYBR
MAGAVPVPQPQDDMNSKKLKLKLKLSICMHGCMDAKVTWKKGCCSEKVQKVAADGH